MRYVVKDRGGNVVNTIISSPEFVELYCQENNLAFETIPEELPEVMTQPPAEQREAAYNTQPMVEWEGKLLTVTQAATKWQYYAAEGDMVMADALTVLIAAAKQTIRDQYPDEEVPA